MGNIVDFNEYGVAISVHESSHERVRAMDPIGGDLSIRFNSVRCEESSVPV